MSHPQTQVYPRQEVPELDERLWMAWKEKHRLKDRARAAKRGRVAVIVVSAGLLGLVGLRMVNLA